MAGRFGLLFSIVLVAAALTGCGASAPSRFYTLGSTAEAAGAPAASYAVLVGPVNVPPLVDRPQFVVQVAPNRVEVNEFNRWAAPLDDGIARAVAGNLSVLLGTSDVAVAPLANFDPDFRVTIDIQSFESTPGEAVVVDVVWSVRRTAAKDSHAGRTHARETVSDASYEALAAAHSRALATVSTDIAATIRAEAANRAASTEP